ncbi:TAXI family TRAP transporter solute-binding subunit [Salarchaeum sp. III]|uniref:TAXI family TRAP transporter solute-binding subunit n=1 Tax=Salarchaeum sp. III TaxID=3107927 RepID=UPI002EDB2225
MVERSIDRREFLYGSAAVGALGLAGCTSGGDSDGGSDMTLRVGTSAGGTKEIGLAVEQVATNNSDSLDYATIESPGFIGTIRRMDQGQFNAGITDNNSLVKAADGRGSFAEQGVDSIPWFGFYGFPYNIYLIARDGTDIETFDDLAGKNVYPAEPGYSTRATSIDVWSQEPTADIYEQMNIIDLSVEDAPGAMEEGSIDACIAYGAPGAGYTGWVTQIASRVDVHYVEPTDALRESGEAYSGAGTSTIEYSNMPLGNQDIGTDTLFTWDIQCNFMFNPTASDDAVYELCRVVDEHNSAVNETAPQFVDFESTSDMHASAVDAFEIHPGAAQYYKDNDAWSDGLTEASRE